MGNEYRSVLASGGTAPTGDAVAADVLVGKTFSNANAVGISGTMVNNGAVSATISGGESYTIPEGYHNGSGVVSATATAYTTLTSLGSVPAETPTTLSNTSIGDIVIFTYGAQQTGAPIITSATGMTLLGALDIAVSGVYQKISAYIVTASSPSVTARLECAAAKIS